MSRFVHGQVWRLKEEFRDGWPSERCGWPLAVRVDSVFSGLSLCIVDVLDGAKVTGPRIQMNWSVFERFYRRA